MAKRLGIGMRAVFLLADDGDWLPGGLTVCLYGCTVDAVELSHVVAAAGVHYFRSRAAARPLAVAHRPRRDDLRQRRRRGRGGRHRDRSRRQAAVPRAYLHVHRPDGTRSVRVSQGTVTTGRGPVPAKFPGIAEATAWLLA